MRLIWFWIRIIPSLPWIYFTALKAQKLPYEQRFPLLKKVAVFVVGKLHIEIEIIGKNNIPLTEGFLFASNHQGSADAFILVSSSDVCITAVSKIEGQKIPFLSTWYKTMEVIYFKRESLKDAVRMASKLSEYLAMGRNVMIFPEGTRSRSQNMNEFKPGAFKGAMKARVPIIPIALINAYIPLDTKQKKEKIKVIYCQPIHYEEYAGWTTIQLAKEVKDRIQTAIDDYQ
ncbi:MAG: lysophospholipid acyltransferase family protein [Erysipelotrichaceae bacterium]|nr:lysophospholipid acyltransferase family protein [Erysipelotrichaceae bacterium]